MFLKRIEMQGFKSFADKIVISFDSPITGIVGPNGCGKSNISDAVRWVLGEQSAKSMRGSSMSDVIFAGSADRRQVNMAEVTLVFDNSSQILNSDKQELEVTRILYRDTQEAEYLINKVNVRLKDVVDLFMDTGLGKDSLSIISQGNVITFADAKPIDRRPVFEEAAGVAKYKKRKIESLSRLERTKENLDRSQDILSELEKQVSPLKRAAHKAEIYREKKKRLEEIEITVLVNEIDEINEKIESAKKTLFDIETKVAMYQTSIQVGETKSQEARKQCSEMEKDISKLQEDLMSSMNEIQALESRKTELDEKRKYIIDTGSKEQKAKELRELLDAAKAEFNDRKQRYESLQKDIALYSEKLSQTAMKIADQNQEYEEAAGMLRSMENRRDVLEHLIKDPFTSQQGVRAIMENRNAMNGILGVIGQVMHAQKGYEEAVSVALGGAMYQIVTADEQSARDAIRFLTRNQSGRATFLPLTVCQPHTVSRENQIIAQNTDGYLGTAADFVDCDPQFEPIRESLLANVLVVNTMENGNNLSSLTKRAYNIVTLDGEVIHRGGSMTGGKIRNYATLMTAEKELQEIKSSIDSQQAKTILAKNGLEKLQDEREEIERVLQERRYQSVGLEPVVDAKQAKYEKLKNDLALVEPNGSEEDQIAQADDLVIRLNAAYGRRDDITTMIKSKREERTRIYSDAERKEQQVRQLRKDLTTASASENAIQIDQAKLETRLENNLNRLASEYQMTYEFAKERVGENKVENAREEVIQLRADIEHLGNINNDAPEEFTAINERYEFLKKQIEELTASRDKILAAIDEMDRVMTTQFRDMFNKINGEFNDIFRSLYGGGKARLVLEDPADILNTGIDIDAQPPGKTIQNNRLFSGGEKSLIALCVLFAILKVKPVPLVILDEVEAALDPSNVERFAMYLHKYTDRTQFIVVTHRPGTMQNCDILYGVTMQHQGVSQMLKVELKEAEQLADKNSADEKVSAV
jgi:chromosome segregation protein